MEAAAALWRFAPSVVATFAAYGRIDEPRDAECWIPMKAALLTSLRSDAEKFRVRVNSTLWSG